MHMALFRVQMDLSQHKSLKSFTSLYMSERSETSAEIICIWHPSECQTYPSRTLVPSLAKRECAEKWS